MTKGRIARIASSVFLALASALTFASAAGADPGGGTTGQTVCTYDAGTGFTTCAVNRSSLSTAGSGSTSYWHFVLTSVPGGVVPSALKVSWDSYYVEQPPWIIPADKTCQTDTSGGEPCGNGNGTWHFYVPMTTQNSDADGNPITPLSAIVVMPSDTTGSNVNFLLSEAPQPGSVTTSTTQPTTTTTQPTTSTTQPTTSTTQPTTSTTQPTTSTTQPTTTTGGDNEGGVSSTTTTGATTTTTGAGEEEANVTSTSVVGETTVLTVPSTKTGQPFTSGTWKLAAGAVGLLGSVVIFPWKRRHTEAG